MIWFFPDQNWMHTYNNITYGIQFLSNIFNCLIEFGHFWQNYYFFFVFVDVKNWWICYNDHVVTKVFKLITKKFLVMLMNNVQLICCLFYYYLRSNWIGHATQMMKFNNVRKHRLYRLWPECRAYIPFLACVFVYLCVSIKFREWKFDRIFFLILLIYP